MSDTKQVSATIKNYVADAVSLLSKKESRSFSQMIEILLEEALVNHKPINPKSKR